MNVASANTVTINNSVFSQGDSIFISSKGAGATTLVAGAGVTINTAGSLVIAQHGGGTLVATSASVFTFFSGAGNPYGTATGGASSAPITVGADSYTMLTFTADGNLVVTKAGLFDCLLVGGGGGAGRDPNFISFCGGGGAGGVTVQTIQLAAATYAVDVGAGGAFFTAGLFSRIASGDPQSLLASGGGIGKGLDNTPNLLVGGGSGGGGAGEASGALNSGQTANQGFAGGNGVATRGQGAGGGGGGSAVGANGSGTAGGAGGAGFDASSFRGESANTTRYAGGGGGSGLSGGAGGSGGGGNRATAGATNTGGGGGGATTTATNDGAAGGSGIVLVRFKL